MSVGVGFKAKSQIDINREAVSKAIGKVNTAILSRFGAFAMRAARQSMRRRKKPSTPGSPPSAHSGKDYPKGPLLKTLLRFDFDPTTNSVVVGPKGVSGKLAPTLQEFGGSKVIKVRKVTPKTARKASPSQAEAYKRKIKDGSIVRTKDPIIQKTIQLPKRPYMRPALIAELPKFPTLYAGKITG